METPVFRLPGIVKVSRSETSEKEDTVDFEGPLMLILELLQKNKVEIKDISISLILEQYVAYLNEMAELNLDIAAEFVVMASRLMLIKTKVMLHESEEVSELDELKASLEQLQSGDRYLQIKEVAGTLSQMYTSEGRMFVKPPEYFEPDAEYRYVHISRELLDAIYRIIGKENLRLSSIAKIDQIHAKEEKYSISQKISEVVDILKRRGDVSIKDLFSECEDRSELVAVVVAILELCRVGSVVISGSSASESSADELTVTYTGTGREENIIDFTTNADEEFDGES